VANLKIFCYVTELHADITARVSTNSIAFQLDVFLLSVNK